MYQFIIHNPKTKLINSQFQTIYFIIDTKGYAGLPTLSVPHI